nr:reverse transcriptase domain-containing protein [Tanacetum cinerariifolium]
SIKVNGVTDNALCLYLFPRFLTHHATVWFDHLPRNSINTFEQMAKMFPGKYFPPSMVTKLRNEITNFCQRPDESLFEAWEHYKLSIDRCSNHNMWNFMKRRPEECYDLIENRTAHHDDWDTSAQRSESSSFITSSSDPEIVALKAEMAEINKNLMKVLQINQQVKAVAHNCETCGGPQSYNDCPATVGQTQNVYAAGAYNQGAYQASGYQALVHQPPIPQPNTITNPKEDLKGITARSGNAYKGPTILTTFSPPQVVERETKVTKDTVPPTNDGSNRDVQHPVVQIETPMPNFEPVSELVEDLVSAPKPNPKPSISYPSRLHDQKLRNKANDQKDKFFQIFQDLNFNISSADALILTPKFSLIIKNLLTNKDKLFEIARTPLNEHYSVVLLKKLPEKLRDPDKFLIPCDFSLSLPELSSTCMTIELAYRSISRPVGVAEGVFVKVGAFYFPADFVVVDFDANPRVSLIIRRSFLKIGRALIDVYKGEPTLRIGKEAVTFNLNQTSRYSANYDTMSVHRIDLIDVACEEYSQEVFGFFMSGNPTPSTKPIVFNSSPTLTPFGDTPLPPQELKVVEPTTDKSSIDEPPMLELKDLPPHLEYAFLEGEDKLPVIIAKDLKDEEKTALIKVLKSHKQALAWQLSDIKGIDPEFRTHKILMEDDFKPAVQHQRRVNLKIHEVIKNEVLKFLDARLIYPISDSPWVSLVHCVPKKGGFIVVENEENELIPTRLVTGWRVCIDYQKLNDVTRKDHFPLPFMDQMLERLAGNEYYCFLDGFSGYFQIPIDPQDQEKTIFTCPYGTFAYRRMPFRLCNAPGTFQMCMMAIFHDMIDKNDGKKSHFMVKEGIVLGHKISKNGIEVDKAKVDVIAKIPHPTTVKGIRSFLGHAGFYRRFIQDFTKIARPMTRLLEKDTPFFFSKECVEAFQTLKRKLTEAPILVAPEWDLPFELMCDASDFAIGALLCWVLLLQEFEITVRDKKGAENLATDHLSRLENPHQSVLDKKEINEM